MSRDEVLITLQNSQLRANFSYSVLSMNEIKIFIDADTKELHCISAIDESAIKWNREIIRVSSKPQERCLLGLDVTPLAWNQLDAKFKSLCRKVCIVIGFKCPCLRRCSRGQKWSSTNLAETLHKSWVW